MTLLLQVRYVSTQLSYHQAVRYGSLPEAILKSGLLDMNRRWCGNAHLVEKVLL